MERAGLPLILLVVILPWSHAQCDTNYPDKEAWANLRSEEEFFVAQKGSTITHEQVEGAGHFFEEPHQETLIDTTTAYVKRRLTETTR